MLLTQLFDQELVGGACPASRPTTALAERGGPSALVPSGERAAAHTEQATRAFASDRRRGPAHEGERCPLRVGRGLAARSLSLGPAFERSRAALTSAHCRFEARQVPPLMANRA